jgi:hypothetical protein
MHEVDTDPYGLTIKPGPPWEVPPKTPAIPLPPNVVVETIDEDVVNKLVDTAENVGPQNVSADNITTQTTTAKETKASSQDVTNTEQHRQDL